MPRSDAAPADQGVSLFTPRSSRRAAGAGGLPSGTPTPAPAQTDIGRSSGSVVGGSLFEKRAGRSSATGGATGATGGTGGTGGTGATSGTDANGAAGADPAAGGAAAGGTYHGLPRRTKQASLSPHLRGSSPASRSADSSASPVDPPAPEHARNLAASLQSGWLRGREEDPKEDPEVPQSEDGQ
jgi:hypothetical protein